MTSCVPYEKQNDQIISRQPVPETDKEETDNVKRTSTALLFRTELPIKVQMTVLVILYYILYRNGLSKACNCDNLGQK